MNKIDIVRYEHATDKPPNNSNLQIRRWLKRKFPEIKHYLYSGDLGHGRTIFLEGKMYHLNTERILEYIPYNMFSLKYSLIAISEKVVECNLNLDDDEWLDSLISGFSSLGFKVEVSYSHLGFEEIHIFKYGMGTALKLICDGEYSLYHCKINFELTNE